LPLKKEKSVLLEFNLDLKGIACSRGSACQSGSSKGSHVLHKLLNNDSFAIQFCLNTKKINGGALSPDETLKRCFNKIFNHISLKISNKIMYEFI